ncbi:MAG TPA: acyltransferase [Nocardioides sp.]|uniref:acyltransferase family protein n=1 Tax=Nocardioides sp. TaxID=35761 RepID=UPI002E33EF8D|nr:acyltransferase [Nocardioides sp.]HEX5088315.1 acyltransferase [Nocardioides sp.]
MPALDGLRGVAVLIVVLDHGQVRAVQGAGGAGVTLFFVLSGFLITGLLLREHDRVGRIDLRAFYRRRARRLLPALTVFLAAVVAHYGSIAVPSAVVTVLYIANVPAAGSGTALFFPLHHMWSLAVEEQFYLLWPAATLLLLRVGRTRRQLAAILLGLTMLCLLLRAGGYPVLGYDWAYRSTLSNLFPLVAGAAVAAYVRSTGWRASGATGLLGILILATATCAPITPSNDWMILRSILTVFGAVMLLTRSDAWMRFAPLRYCGRISYGWYLWHVLFQVELGGIEGAVVSFGVAALSFHLWESWWTGRPLVRRRVAVASAAPALEAA